MKQPLNIICLHMHDMGRWNEVYGLPVPSPNLARFADRSLVFRKAFCAAPTCSPSRAALLTGQSPHEAGMFGLVHRGHTLTHPERHLARFLKAHGYATALFGVQHELTEEQVATHYDTVVRLSPGPEEDRFDRDLRNARAAAEQLRQWPGEKPLFLWAGFFSPHRPFRPHSLTDAERDRLFIPPPLAETAASRRDFADYRATVAVADEAVGILLEALESEAGRNAMVMITTDHGPAFPGMKCNLTDGGLGVTLMIDAPGLPRRGEATDALVSHVDFFPTVCELTGLPAPDWLRGVSLAPVLRGETDSVREEVYGEVTHHVAYEPMRAIRTERYKYIRHFGEDRLPAPANTDKGFAKEEWEAAGYYHRPRAGTELYDLLLDPQEKENRSGQPEFATVEADLARRLDDWMRRTADPLLNGPIPETIPPKR